MCCWLSFQAGEWCEPITLRPPNEATSSTPVQYWQHHPEKLIFQSCDYEAYVSWRLTLYPCLLKKRQGLYCWFGKIKILPVINSHSCNHADGTASLGWSERQSMYSYHSNLRCYITEIRWLRDRKRLTASTSDERRKENDNWVKKCECQISFASSLQKIERISAGPLDRHTMAQAMRGGGGGEQNSGSSLRKNKAIYDISNVCHLFTT